jgi:hypothetical protein
MIEQQSNKLVLTFPTPDSATTFAVFLQSLLTVTASPQPSPSALATSEPVLESHQESAPGADFPAPVRSRHVVLTPERQDRIFNQRQSGQSAHQRLLRAQTTLRDGVLPFSRPGQPPPPTGQPSPRQKAQQEGGFADGRAGVWPEAERRGRSQLRPVDPPSPPPLKS